MYKKDTGQSEGRWILASTPSVDRDQDRVMPFGLVNTDAKVPLIFGHNYGVPAFVAGQTQRTEVGADGVRVLPKWRKPVNEFDPMTVIEQLITEDLVGYSIGFSVLDSEPNEFGGRDITKWELFEVSAVPVGSNRDARLLASKAKRLAKSWPGQEAERAAQVDRALALGARAMAYAKSERDVAMILREWLPLLKVAMRQRGYRI